MASGATIKVRFVRCPKCRLVLPEVADVPMYKCGGCETILIAKNRQTNGRNSIPLQETDASDKKNEVLDSEMKESISSNQNEVLASDDGEVNPDKDSGNPQHTSKECIEEKPDLAFSNEGKQDVGYQSDQDSACLKPTGIDGDWTTNQNGSVGFASKRLSVKLSEDEDEDEDEDVDEVGSNQDKIAHTYVHSSGVSNDEYSHNDLVHNDNDGQSPAPTGKSTVDVSGLNSGIGVKNIESTDDSDARSVNTFKQITSGEIGLTVPANEPKTESISSENLASSDDVQLEQTLEINHHGVSRVTSIDTFYSVDAAGPSSELSGALVYESKSTTGGSSHSYESSISSCDRTDDLICDKRMDPSEESYEVPSHHAPEERLRRNKFLSHSMKSCTSGVQLQVKDFPSDLSEGKYYGAKHKGHRDKVIEQTMYDHPVRSWARFGGSGYPYEAPIPQRAKFAAYETASTSTPLHDEFSRVSNFHSLDDPEDTEKEKMRLLRMVYELQNQLQRSSFFNGRAPSEDSWCEKQFPSYYDYEEHEKEVLYPSYPERHMLRSNWDQQHEYSHITFSGNTMDSRIRDDHSYHPKDWRSAPLPPQALHHNRTFFRRHPEHGFYTSNSSWPSSPQRFSRPPFPVQSYEVMSDDQRYKDRIANRYPREKPGIAKRHLRPTAGGAPLATCSSCMNLLQMPADFIVSRKGLHRLKCGACSTILKFSLERKKHLVPYDPILQVPPQSKPDDNGDTMKQQTSHVYPVSCSDDYGVSYKSYSTEGEPSSAAPPFEPPGNYVDHRKSRNKRESLVEASVSAGASTSEALDKEELPQRGGSPLGPLHRLMGYSSVSQVFKGPQPVDSSKYSNYAAESSQRADKLRMLKKEKRLKQEIE